MALSVMPEAQRVQLWERSFFSEYIRENRFAKLMGTDESSVIHLKEQFGGRIGEGITMHLVNRLTGAGVAGYTPLEGNEEAMDLRTNVVKVDRRRNGVLHDRLDEDFIPINLVEAKRGVLMDWAKEEIRDRIIDSLGSFSLDARTHSTYASTAEATKDTWLTNNTDRLLFGAVKSNTTAADHSASLANIDNTADKLSPALISLAKRTAKISNPRIRPLRVRDDEEWFLLLAGSLPFRDLANDTVMVQANREAMQRGKDNPLFTGGDLIWDGVIIKEVPEIDPVPGVGAGAIQVAPNYLLGAQSIAYGIRQRPKMIYNLSDYNAKKGAGVEFIDGLGKFYFGTGAGDTDTPKQHGVVTVWTAAVADA